MNDIITIRRIKDRKTYALKAFMDLAIVNHVDTWLAGGAVRSMVDKSKIQDYDVFFKSADALNIAKKKIELLDAQVIFECPLGHLTTYLYGGMKIQLISKVYYSDLNDLFTSFDFSCCQFAFDGWRIYTTKRALKDTINKKLRIVSLEYPVATINRVSKYKKKGYDIEDGIKDIVNTLLEAQTEDFPDENMVLYVD